MEQRVKEAERAVHRVLRLAAFTEGKHLNEIQKQQELGKRPYQKFLLILGEAFFWP